MCSDRHWGDVIAHPAQYVHVHSMTHLGNTHIMYMV